MTEARQRKTNTVYVKSKKTQNPKPKSHIHRNKVEGWLPGLRGMGEMNEVIWVKGYKLFIISKF